MSGAGRGEVGKRYHLVACGIGPGGVRLSGLVEGIPDPAKPDDAKRDGRDGLSLITGEAYPGSPFWAALLAAGFIWVGTFTRWWEYSPARASRIPFGQS